MDKMVEFAQRLKMQREKLRLTQAQLAEKVGVSSQTISAYEKTGAGGKGKLPTLDRAVSVAQTLGVSLDYLCGISQDTEEVVFENLADIVTYLRPIAEYFECCIGTKVIPLDEEEVYEVSDGQGNGGYITTTTAAVLTIKSEMLAAFFKKRNKMYRLYCDGTIEEDMYNSWLQGETAKLKKWVIQKRFYGQEEFEAEDS